MAINVSESLFEQIVEYLRARTEASDRIAQNLLKTLETLATSNESTNSVTKSRSDRPDDLSSQFGQKLFDLMERAS